MDVTINVDAAVVVALCSTVIVLALCAVYAVTNRYKEVSN